MELIQNIIIDKSIEDCWDVLGNQFTQIYTWASPVNHSEGDQKKGPNGASCDIRGCNVDGMGNITEKLVAFEPENHFLAYEIITGLPKIMNAARNSWKLTAIPKAKWFGKFIAKLDFLIVRHERPIPKGEAYASRKRTAKQTRSLSFSEALQRR